MVKLSKGRKFTLHKKIKLAYTWFTSKEATSAAIDVTHRCNLKCVHCYWWKERHPEELSDADMIGFMEGLRDKGLFGAIMYGGEPMMRPEVLGAASDIFDLITVFTNGTLGYLDIPSQWILSLDGPEEVHDKIRGEGVFKQAIDNLAHTNIPPIVHMTITQHNKHCIREFMETIHKENIKGVGFSFYTPSVGCEEEDIFIPLLERDRLAEELLEIKKDYPKIVGYTENMAHQLRTDGGFKNWNSLEKCVVSQRIRCYRSNGVRKMCTYGDKADCSRCGCAAVVAYMSSIVDLDLASLRVMHSLL